MVYFFPSFVRQLEAASSGSKIRRQKIEDAIEEFRNNENTEKVRYRETNFADEVEYLREMPFFLVKFFSVAFLCFVSRHRGRLCMFCPPLRSLTHFAHIEQRAVRDMFPLGD